MDNGYDDLARERAVQVEFAGDSDSECGPGRGHPCLARQGRAIINELDCWYPTTVKIDL